METKMFCEIMNRMRKITKATGHVCGDFSIRMSLINGDKILFTDYALLNDYIEASDDGKTYFIPIKNIISIEIF